MSDESRLDVLLREYKRLREAGTPVTPAELCQDCPHLLPVFRRMVAALDWAEELPGQDNGDAPHGVEPPAAAIRLNCPHCRNPIELVVPLAQQEVVCPSCGSSFSLNAGNTLTGEREQLPKLGKFQLLRRLGEGAFGAVYAARDTVLRRTVAIKIPRSGTLRGPDDEDRFLREARNAAQLRHPGIVPVFEVGRSDRFPYIVSELVDGVTLSDVLTCRRLSFQEAAQLVSRIAEALDYSHGQGVIHRDLKPSNIMLSAGDTPRIVDFGLAKREAGEITMTIEGQVLGTPAYMSPEQASGQGHQVDGRSDVYSLGVILYELLTGELPFRGNLRMLLHQVLHDEPRPPRRLNDRIPRDLETICLKAMSKEPRRRYQTASDYAEDLGRFLRSEPIQARAVGRLERGWRWCKRQPVVASLWGMVALLLVTLAFSGAIGSVQQSALRRRAEMLLAQSRYDSASANLQLGRYTRAMLEMGSAVEVADRVGATDLRKELRWQLGAMHPDYRPRIAKHIVGGPLTHLMFSDDAQWLAAGAQSGRVYVWELTGGDGEAFVPRVMQCNGSLTAMTFGRVRTGSTLVTATIEGDLETWELTSGDRQHRVRINPQWIATIGPDIERERVLALGSDQQLRRLDSSTGRIVHAYAAPVSEVDIGDPYVAITIEGMGGRTLRSVPGRNELRAIDSGSPFGWNEEQEGEVRLLAAAYDATSKMLATLNHSDEFCVWHTDQTLELGNTVVTFQLISGPVRRHSQPRSMASCGDSGLSVQCNSRGEIVLIDRATGRQLGRPLQTPENALFAAHPRAPIVATADLHGEVCLWRGPVPIVGMAPQIRTWLHVLTGRELAIEPAQVSGPIISTFARRARAAEPDPDLRVIEISRLSALTRQLEELGGTPTFEH